MATPAGPCSSSRNADFPYPTPCSPVQVPSIAIARRTSRSLSALARASSSGSSGSTRIARWKLPSPTWPTIGASRPDSSRSALVSRDALGEARDRHAGVGGEAAGARPQRAARLVGAVAGVPERAPLALVGGPVEAAAAVRRRRSRRPPWPGRPCPRACRGTRAAASGRRRDRISKWRLTASIWTSSSSSMRATGIAWASTSITQFTAPSSVSNAHAAAVIDSGVGCTRSVISVIRPERALGADEQPRQVVAGGGLARARACPHDLALGRDDGEAEDVLAHRPVADAGGPGRAGGGHPADRGVGAGIDGEEHALGAQLRVELAARHAGLDRDVHVLDRQPQDLVHLRGVDARRRR